LNGIRKYHHFLAALLLALYAFIAAPVQLWHQHNNVVLSSKNSAGVKEGTNEATTFSTSADLVVDVNCKVCSHQYAVYHSPVVIEVPVPLVQYLASLVNYPAATYLRPVYCTSNKGPPACA